MVGRLVHDEEVRRDEEELGERHPGPFASGEDAHLLLHLVPREEEGAGHAADVGLAAVGHQVPERVEDGPLGVEGAGAALPGLRVALAVGLLEVVLGVVASGDAVAEPHHSLVGVELPGHQAQEGGLAGAVRADDGHPLSPLYPGVEGAVDHPRPEGLVDPLEPHHLPAGVGGLGEAEAEGVSLFEDLHLLHPLELLLLAAGLARLGGFRPEPLDEPLELRPLGVLAFGLGGEADCSSARRRL